MTAHITPAPAGHQCAKCPATATWATRHGLACDAHTHPAQRRQYAANARAAEQWGTAS